MKKTLYNIILTSVVILSLLVPVICDAEIYTYVGSWSIGDGPSWTTNPDVYSGQEAAAFLFGGNASDYVISTISNNPAEINFLTFLDGWGDTQYVLNPQSQSWKLDSGAPGYNDPYGGPAYSAYVYDHFGPGSIYVNYAFRVNQGVPEPTTMLLLGFGLAGLAGVRRFKE